MFKKIKEFFAGIIEQMDFLCYVPLHSKWIGTEEHLKLRAERLKLKKHTDRIDKIVKK